MLIVSSVHEVPIRLTTERWQHICRNHPELETQQRRVLETVEEPEEVRAGDFGEKLAVRFYRRTPLTAKHLVVAYREVSPVDGFVVTAYLTRRMPDGGCGYGSGEDSRSEGTSGLGLR